MVGLLAVAPADAASASQTGVLAPDSVTVLADPGTTLAVPADGRLDGYDFAGRVLGVATGTSLGSGSSSMKATSGQKLWVFGLEWTAQTDDGGQPQPVSSTLVVDGSRISFPAYADSPNHDSYNRADSTWNSGSTYWVASVPANAADVAVELASSGTAQTFSLGRMTREGPQPAILYRNPDSWQITQPFSQEKDLPTPDPAGFVPDASMPITLSGATLSWFGPDSPTDTPSDPGQAWLVPQLNNYTDSNPGPGVCYPPLPGSDVTLTLPGQAPIPAQVFPGLGTDKPDFGSFINGYGFKVPAGTTSATLTVTPGTMQAKTHECIDPVAMTAAGSAVFSLTFPADSYTPPAGAQSTPAQIRSLASTAGTAEAAGAARGRSGGGFPTLIIAVVLGVAVLACGGLVARSRPWSTRRRQRRTPGQPVPAGSAPGGAAGAYTAGRSVAPPSPPPEPPVDRPNPTHGVPEPSPETVPHGTSRPSRTVLVVPPREPALPDGQLEVQVLGAPRLVGLPDGTPAMGQTALEILILLAFHRGERLSADQIRTELGRGRERDLDPATIRRYINDLRRVLGDLIPEARTSGGYELMGVGTDVDRFDRHVSTSRANDDPKETANYLAAALALVRGAPFSGGPAGSYGWADMGTQLASVLSNRVHSTAMQLAALALQEGDSALGQWAARQGLLVWPTDDSLNEALLKASAIAKPSTLRQAWTEVSARYVASGETPPAQLYQSYQALRDGPAAD